MCLTYNPSHFQTYVSKVHNLIGALMKRVIIGVVILNLVLSYSILLIYVQDV